MSRRITALMLVLMMATTGLSQGPEALKGAEKAQYEKLKRGEEGVDNAKAKAVIAKQAKYLVGRLNEPDWVNRDSLGALIQDAIRELPIQKSIPREDVKTEQLAFNRAMGKEMVTELQPILKSQKIVVRLNAVRMLSVIAQMGCDDVAAPAVAVLTDPKESEGVKFEALLTLKNLFKYVPEPSVPWKSAFQKENTEFERKAIVALCDYVLRKHDTKTMQPGEVRAIHYNRREACDALGHVRTHRLHYQGAVLAKPGWVLLKVANCDGIEPTPEPWERSIAIYSFTQLFPVTRANVDRQIDLAFAADRIGAPLLDLVTIKANPPPGSGPALASVPWLYYANVWEMGLNTWQTNAKESNLPGHAAVTELSKRASADLFAQLKIAGGVPPDVNAFQQWFTSVRSQVPQLYTDDPTSVVKPIK